MLGVLVWFYSGSGRAWQIYAKQARSIVRMDLGLGLKSSGYGCSVQCLRFWVQFLGSMVVVRGLGFHGFGVLGLSFCVQVSGLAILELGSEFVG